MKRIFMSSLTLFCLLFLFGSAKAQTSDPSNANQKDEEIYYQTSEVDERVKVTSKSYPSSGRNCRENSGRIFMRVYFHKSGKVSDVKVIKPSSCDSFNEEAIRVAKGFKFKPAVKDKQPVSQVASVEFMWNSH